MNRVLKARIIEKFGTQSDFSNTLGINESIVSRVIRDRKELSNDEKKRWTNALDCSTKIFDSDKAI